MGVNSLPKTVTDSVLLPRDAIVARYLLSTGPPQAGIASKQLEESSWFLAWRLPFTSRSSTKTAKRRITQTTPRDRLIAQGL